MLSALPDDERKVVEAELEKARKDAARYRTRNKELEPQAARAKELEDAQKSSEQKALDAQRAAEERASLAQARAVVAEVKALAAAKFADPDDAAPFLELASYVDDKGEIDTAAIGRDLDALIVKKPHLAKGDGREPLRPDRSQGSRGGTGTPDKAQIFGEFIKGQLGVH